jgi:ribosomal protein S18 acetylase RimI-like enzyme
VATIPMTKAGRQLIVNAKDISFVKLLMKANSDAVGFIPTQGIERAAAKCCLIIQRMDGERVGYLLFGPIKPNEDVYIWQECIDKDVRRLGCGQKTFFELLSRAVDVGAKGIRLRCADNLPSNCFWRALGFDLLSTETPNNRRKRSVNVFYMSLKNHPQTEIPSIVQTK